MEFKHLEEIFNKKNTDYGNAHLKNGDVLYSMFPKGIELKTVEDFINFGIFQMMITKMLRIGNLTFKNQNPNNESIADSCNDLSIYSQMLRDVKE